MPGNKSAVREYLERYLASFRKELSAAYVERYSAFLHSLENLVAFTDYLYQENGNGGYFPVSKDDYDRIVALYQDAAAQCDVFLRAEYPADGRGGPDAPASVRNIRAVLENDIRFFSTFVPDGNTSFPDAVEQARGYVIDLTDVEHPVTYGDAMSTRVPVKFTDANGNEVEGFFTSETRLSLTHDYRKIINGFLDKHPELLNEAGALLKPENENIILEPLLKGTLDMSHPNISAERGNVNDYTELLPRDLEQFLNGAGRALRSELDTFIRTSLLLIDRIGIEDDAPISARNNAMSAVANLLGIPETIARSSPMKLRMVENGKVKQVSGTFMARAQGVDLAKLGDLPVEFRVRVNYAQDFQMTPEGLESLAKLQLLDFICHNVDRHVQNMAYDLSSDPTPVLRGVQGFDNDLSFGRRNTSDDGNTYWAPSIDELGVIPASLAEALAHIDVNMLTTALRGCGLSQNEIALTVERIDLVNRRIVESAEASRNMAPGEVKSGVLRMVEKENWKDYDINALAGLSTPHKTNIFQTVKLAAQLDESRNTGVSHYERAKNDDLPIEAYFRKLDEKTPNTQTGIPDTVLDKACDLINLADDLTSFGSSNFRRVRDSVLELRRVVKSAWNGPDGKALHNAEFCTRYQTALENVRNAASIYLVNKKRRSGFLAENRIRAVSIIASFAERQYSAFREASELQDELDTRAARREEYKQQVRNDLNAEREARRSGNRAVRPALQRVQTQIRDVQNAMPENGQRWQLCARALAAQEALYDMAESRGPELTAEEQVQARALMATLVSYDLALRAKVFEIPDFDEAAFQPDDLIRSVSDNGVFKAETAALSKESLKKFVDHNYQRRMNQKIITVGGLAMTDAPKQRENPVREAEKLAGPVLDLSGK